MIVKDGDALTLGNTTFRLAWHPGHTPAASQLTSPSTMAAGRTRPTSSPGPHQAQGVPATEQFLATINRLEQIQQRVQVRVVSHPFMDPTFWDRVERLAGRRPGDPHPFVAPAEFGAWLTELKQVGIKRLEDAKAKAASQN